MTHNRVSGAGEYRKDSSLRSDLSRSSVTSIGNDCHPFYPQRHCHPDQREGSFQTTIASWRYCSKKFNHQVGIPILPPYRDGRIKCQIVKYIKVSTPLDIHPTGSILKATNRHPACMEVVAHPGTVTAEAEEPGFDILDTTGPVVAV
jgi:hypothetical protein